MLIFRWRLTKKGQAKILCRFSICGASNTVAVQNRLRHLVINILTGCVLPHLDGLGAFRRLLLKRSHVTWFCDLTTNVAWRYVDSLAINPLIVFFCNCPLAIISMGRSLDCSHAVRVFFWFCKVGLSLLHQLTVEPQYCEDIVCCIWRVQQARIVRSRRIEEVLSLVYTLQCPSHFWSLCHLRSF